MHTAKLIALIRAPESVADLTGEDWNDIVLSGRKNQLLGQLAALFDRHQRWADIPTAVQRHLRLELLTAQRRAESALWELTTIRRTVNLAVGLTVLKGCAYVVAGDINHAGRSFSDVDVMVPHELLQGVETDLIGGGWKPSTVDAYDEAYYRNWMHEVPPMEHVRRHTVLDLHHAINPPVADYYVNPAHLMASRLELFPGVFVLAPLDRVIHCAIHLIQEGEPKKLLRDLYDLHLLLGQHCVGKNGLQPLFSRARDLGVQPLVSSAVAASAQVFAQPLGGFPTTLLEKCLVVAAKNAQNTGSLPGWCAGIAILVYSHWIKMPLKLLVPHLCRKSVKAIFSNDDEKNRENQA